ncbi:acetylxylan esterase [Verrucomicrobiota bacterium]|nr:acetylxylan esterase [Verrucomicrobiota bacterium]
MTIKPLLALRHCLVAAALLLTAITIRAAEPAALPAREKLHLYLLIGQSNMAGRGLVEAQDKQPHPRVLTLTKEGKWVPAVDPIHYDKPNAGVGLGTTFGKVMAERDATVTIGLIPCAVGGTPISRWQKDADLYEAALKRARAAAPHGVFKGILWHQGEADSGKEETAKVYAAKLDAMIAAWRKDLEQPNLPVVVGQLGEFYAGGAGVKLVREAQQTVPERVPHTGFAPATDLNHKGDKVHFDAAAYREFGKRYATAMVKLQSAGAAEKK